jgi:hypothetical protein
MVELDAGMGDDGQAGQGARGQGRPVVCWTPVMSALY